MRLLGILLAIGALACAPVAALAGSDPLHNPLIATDVDGNQLVQPRDAELIIGLLMRESPATAGTMSALAESQTGWYYDTTNDGFVSPRDAVLVINHLLVAPEPGSLALAGIALAALVGVVRRKARR